MVAMLVSVEIASSPEVFSYGGGFLDTCQVPIYITPLRWKIYLRKYEWSMKPLGYQF